MKRLATMIFSMSLAACAARGTISAQPVPVKPRALAAAVQKFLADKGGYCLGKPDWPRLVTDVDRRKHRPDALQMPVLEHLGVVSGVLVPREPTSTLYSLTATGRQFYVDYAPTASTPVPTRPGDLCVAQLWVLKVTRWTPIQVADGVTTTMVSYTYEVARAAPWTDDPEFRRVFPVVAEILSGGNKLEMMLPLQWNGRIWSAAVPAR
jgi:hypothetical protein